MKWLVPIALLLVAVRVWMVRRDPSPREEPFTPKEAAEDVDVFGR